VPPPALGELARIFLRLGVTAFGGPAAHVAMMREELVTRRKWLDDAEFLDLVAATNLIPGPNSTELALHLGLRRAGWAGFWVAGACFILPAAILTGACAWAWHRWGEVPEAGWLLSGVQPVVVGVIAHAAWGMAPAVTRTAGRRAAGVMSAVAVGLGADELLVLLVAGLVFALPHLRARPGAAGFLPLATVLPGAVLLPVSAGGLFWVFLKIGSVLYGSGYVLVAFLRDELVVRRGWLTEAQLLDAVAVGQLTPGPVFTTATFVGGILAGPAGAVAATVGIFLPAFVFVALSGPLVPRLRASPLASGFLDGVTLASLALLVVVTIQLAATTLGDPVSVLLAAGSLLALSRGWLGSTSLLFLGAAVGFVVARVG